MTDSKAGKVEINGASVHVGGDGGETVNIGPGGIHVMDGNSEVKVSWCGIRVRDGGTSVNISVWKPLAGCGLGIIVLVAILTFVIVGIVKLML
jgi:hypothetical protein